MKKKLVSLMVGAMVFALVTPLAKVDVLAATPNNTPQKIINGDDGSKQTVPIPVYGEIGPWNDKSSIDVNDTDKPEVAELSVTVPTKIAFMVSTNVKKSNEVDKKGKFISPEYKISNNSASSKDVEVILKDVVQKNNSGKLELNPIKGSDGKVQIDLQLQLGSEKAINLTEDTNQAQLGFISRGQSKILKLSSNSWEIPTEELGDGTEVVKSSHELVLEFQLKDK